MTFPVSGYPLAAFRILLGLLLLVNGGLLIPDLSVWLTDSAVSSFQVIRENSTGGRMNLFAWLGDSPRVVSIVVASYMIAATGLLLGWKPRVMGAVVFLCLTSFTHRNPFACSSGDTLLRLMSFFFIWAPPNLPWSAGRPSKRIGPVFPAALRCMQFQVCLVYFAGFLAKLQGSMWRDGTAVHMVLQLSEFSRFPLPDWLFTESASKTLSWFTLALEGLFPILVCFKETRIFMLAAIALFHLGVEYCMNIQLFEWIMIATIALFLSEHEIRRPLEWLRSALFRGKRNVPTPGD